MKRSLLSHITAIGLIDSYRAWKISMFDSRWRSQPWGPAFPGSELQPFAPTGAACNFPEGYQAVFCISDGQETVCPVVVGTPEAMLSKLHRRCLKTALLL